MVLLCYFYGTQLSLGNLEMLQCSIERCHFLKTSVPKINFICTSFLKVNGKQVFICKANPT